MSAYTYKLKPKQNLTPNRKHGQIEFFYFQRPNFSKYAQHNFTYPCTYTTTCVVYNLVIIDVIEELSSETVVWLFYNYKTTDFCGTKPRVTLMAVTWNNIRKSVELPGLCQIIHAFLRFCLRIRFICKRSAKNETMHFFFCFSFGVYVKQP